MQDSQLVTDSSPDSLVDLSEPRDISSDEWTQPDDGISDTPNPDDLITEDTSQKPDWWRPTQKTSWQWQLSSALDTGINVAMYDVDLFDVSKAVIAALKTQGRVVICYFSAGSYENWREDKSKFSSADYGNKLAGWDGEFWLDIRRQNVRNIMRDRLDLAFNKGCDGVEPDNVDGYDNNNGLGLTKQNQLDYNRFLAKESHARGLSVGLKNALGLIPDLIADFDWALNEECLSYDECALLKPFIDANKAVFHVEYVDKSADGAAKKKQVCGQPTINGFSTLIKTWDLDAWRLPCD